MTDTIIYETYQKKTWAELGEEEDWENDDTTQNSFEIQQKAGTSLSNYQNRLIDNCKKHSKAITIGLSNVPKSIQQHDILNHFKQYQINKGHFEKDHYIFQLSLQDSIDLITNTDLTIKIKNQNIKVVILPVRNI